MTIFGKIAIIEIFGLILGPRTTKNGGKRSKMQKFDYFFQNIVIYIILLQKKW